jgi:hypothetical protein
MKLFRRFVGYQLCPRCKEKKLSMRITCYLLSGGGIKSAVLKIQADSNPACMWEGEEYSLTSEQAKRVIQVAEMRDSKTLFPASSIPQQPKQKQTH